MNVVFLWHRLVLRRGGLINVVFLILFFVSGIQSVYSQEESDTEECSESKKLALLDANTSGLKHRIHGLVKMKNPDFSKYFELFVYTTYDIQIQRMGCVIMEGDLCYTNTMDSIINQKYGDGFLKNLEKQFTRKDLPDTDVLKSKILDSAKIYNFYLESYPKFIGNDKVIKQFLENRFTAKTKDLHEQYSAVTLVIDREGKVTDINLTDKYLFKNTDKSSVLSEIKKLGSWVPAYIYGTPVKSTIDFYPHM